MMCCNRTGSEERKSWFGAADNLNTFQHHLLPVSRSLVLQMQC